MSIKFTYRRFVLDGLDILVDANVLECYLSFALSLQRAHLLQEILPDLLVRHVVLGSDRSFCFNNLLCPSSLLMKSPKPAHY